MSKLSAVVLVFEDEKRNYRWPREHLALLFALSVKYPWKEVYRVVALRAPEVFAAYDREMGRALEPNPVLQRIDKLYRYPSEFHRISSLVPAAAKKVQAW